MKLLYFDCPSGISGNMTVGALLELLGEGAEEYLREELAKIPAGGYRLDVAKRSSCGISGTHVKVTVDGVDEYGHVHSLDGGHTHDNHDHTSADHVHPHMHRNYYDVLTVIENSDITDEAKDIAIRIFQTIAEAEAKVHGKSLEEVHFHEVGAIDSIIDIVGSAILIDRLEPDVILAGTLTEGCGFIDCAHGRLSVPVPATAEIFRSKSVKFRQCEVGTELVTPTGAAIIGTLVEHFMPMPEMTLLANGFGLGTKEIGRPNALRAYLGECDELRPAADGKTPAAEMRSGSFSEDDIIVIETNIDDSTGEEMGYAMETLFAAGARDVFFTPIYMKKNRPAYMLSVICTYCMRDELLEIIFRETTSIGARYYRVDRVELERDFTEAETKYGTITAKRVLTPAGCEYVYPEYEDMKRAAGENGASLKMVRRVFEDALNKC